MLPSFFLHSDREAPRLKVGLLLNSTTLQACFAEVVDHILSSDFANLELVVLNAEKDEPRTSQSRTRSIAGKVLHILANGQSRRTALYDLYQRWDKRNINPAIDPHTPIDCSGRLAHLPTLPVVPIRKRFVHRFPPEAVEQIKQQQLDVLVRFGFNILRGEILTAAKYGVWSYHHGDGDHYRGGPAHFWEVYERHPISGAMLQVLTEELDAGKVLCKGKFATTGGISRARNCVAPYWGTTTFVIQKLRELHQHGWPHLQQAALAPTPYCGRKKIYTSPSNVEMARWLVPTLLRKSVQRGLRRPLTNHWRLAIRSGGPLIPDSTGDPDLQGFQWIESPRGRFYADPFLHREAGNAWVFFEDFDYATQRGIISCAPVKNGALGGPIPALERPYHLSYPCIFRDGNDLYMIPETGANGSVELYRCTGFPDKWEFVKELFRSAARPVDTTVWSDSGLYWFLVTLREPRGSGSQLWLFSASGLTASWHPHPANPLSTDVQNSRCGGAVFRHRGKLYRPSQDCSGYYGNAMTLNEILVCDPLRYQERPAAHVTPTWAPRLIGTHTYSHLDDIEIIDGCVQLPSHQVGDPVRRSTHSR